jgi:hypothetical protein
LRFGPLRTNIVGFIEDSVKVQRNL